MNRINFAASLGLACALALTAYASGSMAKDKSSEETKKSAAAAKASQSDVNNMIADWPARPRLAVREMSVKYGEPTEITTNRAIWMNAGPYKKIEVSRIETPHDFPKPHMDFLRHTISYNVPIDKIDDLIAFDASMTFDKTAGEMEAKCDLEGHNILTLNLARDIIDGKKSVADARKSFAMNVVDDQLGKKPDYVEKLLIKPATMDVAFADKPNIPGSPVRATTNSQAHGTDAETLAFVIASDDNEILAAAQAQKKDIGADVKEYAKMLQTEHGKNQATSMKLGQQLKTVPMDTKPVDELRVKGASDLAKLVPLNGKEFEKAYLTAMVKNHEEVLSMIDGQLSKNAKNAELKKQLASTREHVAKHLEQAKKLL